MNWRAAYAIFTFEMARFKRTFVQSLISPVISTVLYFVVFGAAIGSRIQEVDGVAYGSFIVPGLVMLTMLMQSISNASFGIYFPKFIGTIYEIMSAPISAMEIVVGYVGAAAIKALIVGSIIILTSMFFVELRIEHPIMMVVFMLLTTITFALFGFIIGLWAKNFEQLNLVPMLVVTPLVFLGGSFYSIKMLPDFWQGVSYFNPVLYLVSGFRWSFFGEGDVSIWASLAVIGFVLTACLLFITWMFKTGTRLRN